MKHLNVCVPSELLGAIDTAAAARSLNRSEYVRLLLGRAMAVALYPYELPTLPNWQVEAWTALLRGLFGVQHLILSTDVKTMLKQAVGVLDERQARVLRLRFGLDGRRYTGAEVAAIMGWESRQRVLQVETLALARVRGWCRGRGIWGLIGPQLNKEEAK